MKLKYEITKQTLDSIFGTVAFIICIPVYMIIGIVIKATVGGHVFYKQQRIGKDGKKFYLYKFRTMVDGADKIEDLPIELQNEYKENYKIKNDPRITKIGRVLRNWNLDELPQLLNIVKGNMSFIGPRPVIQEEVEKYGNLKSKFLSVKPGLSGYWQINTKKCKDYNERINMELYYIENCSLKFDINIFLETVKMHIPKNKKIEQIKVINLQQTKQEMGN